MWKKMTVEQRYQVVALFKMFEEEAENDPSSFVWGIDNVWRLMELGYFPYDELHKICGCYLTTKEDLSVFIDPIPMTEEQAAKES